MPLNDDERTKSDGRQAAKSFLASLAVLAALMLAAGLMGRALPAGSYERYALPDGSSAVLPGSYAPTLRPDYPAWRWLTAPLEVLAGEDAALAIVIIAFIVIVGGAFALLKEAGVLEASVEALAARFGARRKLFLAAVCLFFMLIGSFMGIFEEVVPLVPLAVSLALSFGWDVFTGLGMSVLAVGFGFSAAIANPFSIGTAQKLAGIPVLSGAPFRIASFILIYALYLAFMLSYVNALEKKRAETRSRRPVKGRGRRASRGDEARRHGREGGAGRPIFRLVGRGPGLGRPSSSITGIGSDSVLPIIALGFLVIGLGAGLSAGIKPGAASKILRARRGGRGARWHTHTHGTERQAHRRGRGVMDTILHGASETARRGVPTTARRASCTASPSA